MRVVELAVARLMKDRLYGDVEEEKKCRQD
jgi:hypothetical protein